MSPLIKIMALSNVYCRMMNFVNKGDVENGHCHTYDHATLVSSGSVLYEVLDGHDGATISSKEFVAPNMIFVNKNNFHRITALEDNTVCSCIHALRTIEGDLIDPDSLIEPIINDEVGASVASKVLEVTGEQIKPFAIK